MNKMYLILFSLIFLFGSSCARPMIDAEVMVTKPVSKIISADANTIYYGIRWAFEQEGYPVGQEDLPGGVIESKWVPTGAASHYVKVFDGKDYGANAAYYKMIVTIIPMDAGESKVEAYTRVQSIVSGMKSTGDKERAVLNRIAEHARGYEITVTNLGVEE